MSAVCIAPGPFARLTHIHFPGWRFRFHIMRDDGLHYTPYCGEGITLSLYAETGEWLFSGFSAQDGNGDLPYEEGIPALVSAFVFEEGYYSVSLNSLVIQDVLGFMGGPFRCSLMTDGVNTLKTYYPRQYGEGGSPTLIKPGYWSVIIPYWSVVRVDHYPNLITTVRRTTVYASIPYASVYRIQDGNALGRFLFPLLGVVWTPNADLSGWQGLFQVENVCTQGEIAVHWQYPNISPPSQCPTDAGERIFMVYANAILQVALGSCPDVWPGSRIDVSTGFGYEAVIPFSSVLSPGFQVDVSLPGQPGSLWGAESVRQYVFHWDRSTFHYDTGEGMQRYEGQTATLLQSPPLDFEQWIVVPLPEVTE